uniref:Uncharacterized protein n=1 Tax=Schistocephalus solidus TaxID=70667 RepID=A0A0X3PDZ5_SCHSO
MRTTGSMLLLFVVLLSFSGAQGIWKGFGLGLISMLKKQFRGDTDESLSANNFKNFLSALQETYDDLKKDPEIMHSAGLALSDVTDGKKDMPTALLNFMMGKSGLKVQTMIQNIFERSGQPEFAARMLEIVLKAYQVRNYAELTEDIHELGNGLKTILLQALEYLEEEIRQNQRSYEF